MTDDGLELRVVNLSSPRGMRYTVFTELEIVLIRIYEDGSITAGRGMRRGSMGPHLATNWRMFPAIVFETAVGELGWVEWRIQAHWGRTGFVTAAPVLWIDAAPLPRM